MALSMSLRAHFIGPLCKDWDTMKVCHIIHAPSRTWDCSQILHPLPDYIIDIIKSVPISTTIQNNEYMDYPVWPSSNGFSSAKSAFVSISSKCEGKYLGLGFGRFSCLLIFRCSFETPSCKNWNEIKL